MLSIHVLAPLRYPQCPPLMPHPQRPLPHIIHKPPPPNPRPSCFQVASLPDISPQPMIFSTIGYAIHPTPGTNHLLSSVKDRLSRALIIWRHALVLSSPQSRRLDLHSRTSKHQRRCDRMLLSHVLANLALVNSWHNHRVFSTTEFPSYVSSTIALVINVTQKPEPHHLRYSLKICHRLDSRI